MMVSNGAGLESSGVLCYIFGERRAARRAARSVHQNHRRSMRRTLLILGLALPLVSACASGGGMRPQYDRAAGTSTVSRDILDASPGGVPMRVTASYSWRGQGTPAPAQAAYLNFIARPRTDAGLQWRSNNQLRVLVDGEQRATYNGRYDGEARENGLYEHMVYHIPITDLSVLASASRVEGRIGQREFVLQGEELARLREFVEYVRGGGR